MSAVFCGQALASTESASSGQSATSQFYSALPGLKVGPTVSDGRNKPAHILLLYDNCLVTLHPKGVIKTAATRGRKEVHSRGGRRPRDGPRFSSFPFIFLGHRVLQACKTFP